MTVKRPRCNPKLKARTKLEHFIKSVVTLGGINLLRFKYAWDVNPYFTRGMNILNLFTICQCLITISNSSHKITLRPLLKRKSNEGIITMEFFNNFSTQYTRHTRAHRIKIFDWKMKKRIQYEVFFSLPQFGSALQRLISISFVSHYFCSKGSIPSDAN